MAYHVRRNDYLSHEDYARAVHEAGGPPPSVRLGGPGPFYARLLDGIHGGGEDQQQPPSPRRHAFDKKARRRR